MSYNPVGWFEIYVDDLGRAKAFYEGVLGTTLQALPTPAEDVAQMLAFPMNPEGTGASGALVKMDGDRPAGNSVIVYFTCNDCGIEGGRVVENGGSIMKDKFSIGDYGFIVLANDTEGNVFGLHSME